MKNLLSIAISVCIIGALHAQDAVKNSMSVMINDQEYKAEPHRVKIGAYGYITGNTINPDKSLRIWFGAYDGKDLNEPGRYLVIGEDENPNKEDSIVNAWATGNYKGLAYVKYVEETKSPRMEYHVGEAKYSGQFIEVANNDDGTQTITFDLTLEGSWWKEKSTATAFGGLDRFAGKLQDKAVTGASGYEQNIDPEGAGYKKQKEMDVITLKQGTVKIKLKD